MRCMQHQEYPFQWILHIIILTVPKFSTRNGSLVYLIERWSKTNLGSDAIPSKKGSFTGIFYCQLKVLIARIGILFSFSQLLFDKLCQMFTISIIFSILFELSSQRFDFPPKDECKIAVGSLKIVPLSTFHSLLNVKEIYQKKFT